jgi:hypothetical protein
MFLNVNYKINKEKNKKLIIVLKARKKRCNKSNNYHLYFFDNTPEGIIVAYLIKVRVRISIGIGVNLSKMLLHFCTLIRIRMRVWVLIFRSTISFCKKNANNFLVAYKF